MRADKQTIGAVSMATYFHSKISLYGERASEQKNELKEQSLWQRIFTQRSVSMANEYSPKEQSLMATEFSRGRQTNRRRIEILIPTNNWIIEVFLSKRERAFSYDE